MSVGVDESHLCNGSSPMPPPRLPLNPAPYDTPPNKEVSPNHASLDPLEGPRAPSENTTSRQVLNDTISVHQRDFSTSRSLDIESIPSHLVNSNSASNLTPPLHPQLPARGAVEDSGENLSQHNSSSCVNKSSITDSKCPPESDYFNETMPQLESQLISEDKSLFPVQPITSKTTPSKQGLHHSSLHVEIKPPNLVIDESTKQTSSDTADIPITTPIYPFQTTPPVSPVLSYVVPECLADTEDEDQDGHDADRRGIAYDPLLPAVANTSNLPPRTNTADDDAATPGEWSAVLVGNGSSSLELSETSRCRLSSTSSSSDSYYDTKFLSKDKVIKA